MAGIGGVATCCLSAVTRPKTMIESGNDARHVVCRETVVVPDILTLARRAEQGSPGEHVSLSACERVSSCALNCCAPERGSSEDRTEGIRQTGRSSRGGSGSGTGMTRDWEIGAGVVLVRRQGWRQGRRGEILGGEW